MVWHPFPIRASDFDVFVCPRGVEVKGTKRAACAVFRVFCEAEQHIEPLNAELNPICHLLTLLGAHHIFHVCRIRVKQGNRPLNIRTDTQPPPTGTSSRSHATKHTHGLMKNKPHSYCGNFVNET